MRLRLTTPLLALLLSACAAAPAPKVIPPAPAGPPKLILAIAVDQLSADSFAQYRQHFTGGLARLANGSVFPSGYQSHAATETCPGHSTILTGVRPARNGIIANYWFDPAIKRAEKRIYCSEDVSNPASSPINPVVTANFLKVPTLGERLKSANPASRNVAVSAKDRAVMMMGGHDIDAAYWWKGSGFATLAGRDLAPAALDQNAAIADAVKKGSGELPVPAWCKPLDRAVTVGKTTVGTAHFAHKAGELGGFRQSPRLDGATADLALRLVDTMGLGKGAAPDVLSVSFSATDMIGHAYGTEGVEMCIQLSELDKTLGRLLAQLDAKGIDYLAVLTADHGGFDVPERLVQQGLPRAARSDAALEPAELAKKISEKTGITTKGPLLYADGPAGDFYISADLNSEDKARVSAALVALVKDHPQVAEVFTAAQLAETPMSTKSPQEWTLRERARASFDARRSGDVLVLLERAIVPISKPGPGYTATHGSPWDYDRRVPILFWRRGMAAMEQPAPVEVVDIAPTLSAILGLSIPDGAYDGRCLDIDGSGINSCDGAQ